MTITSVADLVDTISRCELLKPEQTDELVCELAAHISDPRLLANELIRLGWLTPYQVNRLTQGRGRELRVGRYVLLERLGRGGMGRVFKARRQGSDQVIALKLLRKEYLSHPLALRRFCREAQAVAQLAHPNIVRALETGQVGNLPFLAMEHVAGADLARLVEQSGALPIAQACDYARQAALGLQHAHERGIVHRDVKPSNLLVTEAGPGTPAVVKIVDFGLARLESEAAAANRLTRLGRTVGTVDYMAPEQAVDCRVADIRSDIYSLGCSLFYLLTGRSPLEADNTLKDMPAQLAAAPPVERFRPDVTAELSRVLAKMLARDPARRHQTPAEAARALEPFSTAAVPIGTVPLPPAVQTAASPGPEAPGTTGRSRQRRWLALAGAAAVLLIGVGLVLAMRPFAATEPHNEDRPGKGAGQPRKNSVTSPGAAGSKGKKVKKKEEVEEEPDPKEQINKTRKRKKEEVEDQPGIPADRP